jgi:hydroxymethylbilane synthase
MINGQVDIAVHSMKDVPTALPVGIVLQGWKSNNPRYISTQGNVDFLNELGIIATGSLRRQAQWLNKYPTHKAVDLRGNVNTRMQNYKTALGYFAAAGLERINLKPQNYINLDWMIPSQGAMLVVAMQKDSFAVAALI